MARIRDDLEGTVYLHTGGPDGPLILSAGDAVPEGHEVDAQLLADQDDSESDQDHPDNGDKGHERAAAKRSPRTAKA